MVENAVGAIILTAHAFNPSIFSETWLVKNAVVNAESLVGPRICSQQVAQFETQDMQVTVLPPRMEIVFRIQGVPSGFAAPRQVAVRTVELLPHTPYQSLGMNFDYFVAQPKEQDFSAYNRALLGTGEYRLLREFSESDARFGRYLSKDHEGSRLRLDIKPVKAGPENKDMLKFSFNFHYSVANIEQSERAMQLHQLIGRLDAIQTYALKLLEMGNSL